MEYPACEEAKKNMTFPMSKFRVSSRKAALCADAAQPKHHEAVIAVWGDTHAETRTEHKALRTVLDIGEEAVTKDLLTLAKFLQVQKN